MSHTCSAASLETGGAVYTMHISVGVTNPALAPTYQLGTNTSSQSSNMYFFKKNDKPSELHADAWAYARV
jgi:hypothetical protein